MSSDFFFLIYFAIKSQLSMQHSFFSTHVSCHICKPPLVLSSQHSYQKPKSLFTNIDSFSFMTHIRIPKLIENLNLVSLSSLWIELKSFSWAYRSSSSAQMLRTSSFLRLSIPPLTNTLFFPQTLLNRILSIFPPRFSRFSLFLFYLLCLIWNL